MTIKKLFIGIIMMMGSMHASAQIMLSPIFDSAIDGLNENNITLAEGRLRNIISSLGMNSSYGGRFVLACKAAALQREVSGSKLIQHLEISFAVGDNYSNTCFGNTSIECIGIGNTEEQAMTNALKNIKNNAELKKIIEESKARIIDYYNQNAVSIIQKAKGLIAVQQWEEALYELSYIPQECTLFSEAQIMMEKVYTEHINHDAQQVLNEAQAMWSADPNPGYNAEQAMAILATINTSAKCYPQAQALMKKIEARLKSISDQERRNEQEMERARLKAATAVSKARINACRDIAVAYAKRKVVVNKYYRTWW